MTQATAETIARPFERVCDTANTSEWLAHRDGGVGASEIAILLGASEWGSNLELYYRKLGELADSREDNELMLWGRLLERPILDALERGTDAFARAWEEGAEAAFDAEYSGPLFGRALDEFYASNPYRGREKTPQRR